MKLAILSRAPKSYSTRRLKEAALQLGAISSAEFDRIVDPRKMVSSYVAVN